MLSRKISLHIFNWVCYVIIANSNAQNTIGSKKKSANWNPHLFQETRSDAATRNFCNELSDFETEDSKKPPFLLHLLTHKLTVDLNILKGSLKNKKKKVYEGRKKTIFFEQRDRKKIGIPIPFLSKVNSKSFSL